MSILNILRSAIDVPAAKEFVEELGKTLAREKRFHRFALPWGEAGDVLQQALQNPEFRVLWRLEGDVPGLQRKGFIEPFPGMDETSEWFKPPGLYTALHPVETQALREGDDYLTYKALKGTLSSEEPLRTIAESIVGIPKGIVAAVLHKPNFRTVNELDLAEVAQGYLKDLTGKELSHPLSSTWFLRQKYPWMNEAKVLWDDLLLRELQDSAGMHIKDMDLPPGAEEVILTKPSETMLLAGDKILNPELLKKLGIGLGVGLGATKATEEEAEAFPLTKPLSKVLKKGKGTQEILWDAIQKIYHDVLRVPRDPESLIQGGDFQDAAEVPAMLWGMDQDLGTTLLDPTNPQKLINHLREKGLTNEEIAVSIWAAENFTNTPLSRRLLPERWKPIKEWVNKTLKSAGLSLPLYLGISELEDKKAEAFPLGKLVKPATKQAKKILKETLESSATKALRDFELHGKKILKVTKARTSTAEKKRMEPWKDWRYLHFDDGSILPMTVDYLNALIRAAGTKKYKEKFLKETAQNKLAMATKSLQIRTGRTGLVPQELSSLKELVEATKAMLKEIDPSLIEEGEYIRFPKGTPTKEGAFIKYMPKFYTDLLAEKGIVTKLKPSRLPK